MHTLPAASSARLRWPLRVATLMAGLATLYLAACWIILGMAIAPVRHPHEHTPMSDGLQAEPVTLQSPLNAGEPTLLQISGYFLPSTSDVALVMVHGLDSNAWRGFHRELAREYQARGYSVLLLDLRGHGTSDGDALGLAWKEREEIRAAVAFLQARGFLPGRIGIHGTSYGAATALLAAADIPAIAAVVADSPFADFRDLMGTELERRIGLSTSIEPGIRLLTRLRYQLDLEQIAPILHVARIAPRPILLMHGEDDPRIPAEHSQRLLEASSNPANTRWLLAGAPHTQAFALAREEFLHRVLTFFGDAFQLSSAIAPASAPEAAPAPAPAPPG